MLSTGWPALLKKNSGSIFIFVFVAVVTHMDANVAMLFGEGFGIYAVVLLLMLLVRFSSWTAQHTSEEMHRVKKTGFRFIYAAALCAVAWQGISFVHHTIDARFQPVIEKLEAYKTIHGAYPEKLEEVVERPPRCAGMTPPPSYRRSKKGDAFSLLCMTVGFNHHEYSSSDQDRGWKDRD